MTPTVRVAPTPRVAALHGWGPTLDDSAVVSTLELAAARSAAPSPSEDVAIASTADPRDFEGRMVIDSNGHRVGRVELVYIDPESMALQWGLVRTGLLGRPVIVPLVQTAGEGTRLRLPHTREQIALAPRVNPRHGQLTESEEKRLAHHYGLAYSQQASATGLVEPRGGSAPAVQPLPPSTADTPDTSSVVRSEERVAVRLVQRPHQRVRLVKRLVREPASATVSIRREELRIERGPVAAVEGGTPVPSVQLAASEWVMTLMREEPLIEKRIQPVERVRLAKDVTVEERTVHAELRREQVEVEHVSHDDRPA
ncbi:MAG: PRC and DUF2382 domain-containing protein [Candidatus Dormibacteria bacterium]